MITYVSLTTRVRQVLVASKAKVVSMQTSAIGFVQYATVVDTLWLPWDMILCLNNTGEVSFLYDGGGRTR